MKNLSIGHISDVHLGYSSGKRINKEGINLRVIDGYNAWDEAIYQMIQEALDAVIISGDIFHMAHPDIRTIVKAQEGLRRLADAGIAVYVGAGNHDATDIRAEIPANGVLNEPNNNILSFVEPYIVKEISPGYHFHFLNHHAYTDQGETMKQIKLIDNEINILVSHGSCFDTNMNVILHCPQEPREVVIPEFVMNMGWDYTLLGHIHERGWIGSKDGKTDTSNRKQFYGGSVIRRGFTDRPCALGRGWTKWDVDSDRKFTPTFFNVHQRPQIDCDKIEAGNLTPVEVEEALVNQLKSIYNQYKEDESENISGEFAPIVRQTVVGLTPVSYVAIDWSNCSKYSRHFLTYTLKRIDAAVASDDTNEAESSEDLKTNKDIVEAFETWMETAHTDEKEFEDKTSVEDKAKQWLRKGQDAVLENEGK